MSLSENERLIIVRRELEKADRTYDDVVFCANEADEEKLKPYIQPTKLLIDKISHYVEERISQASE